MEMVGLLEAVTRWARDREDVVGLALVGSHARGLARPDSDVDLAVLSKDPSSLINDQSWTANFGNTREIKTEQYGPMWSVRVFYEHGPEVEFGLADPSWAQVPLDPGTQRVISDGIRILFDPAGVLRAAKDAAA